MYDAKLSSRSVIHDSAGSAGRTMAEGSPKYEAHFNCMNIFSIFDVKTSRESRWWKHHLILSSTRTTGATLIFTFRYPTSMYTLILGVVVP